MPVDVVRDAAIDVILRVFEKGAYLDVSLDRTLRRKQLKERGRRFLTQLAYGTVRHRLLSDFILEPLLHQPIDDLPRPILAILRMGVFQALFCNQVTFPAMVHTSVDLAKKRGHAGTARLVNAVLKRVPQSLDAVTLPDPDGDPLRYLSVRYSLPEWLVAQWQTDFGIDQARAMCEASDSPAATCLRANTMKVSVEALVDELGRAGFPGAKRTAIPEEVTLEGGMPTASVKAFQHGHFVVQDAASMLPAHLVEPQPGDTVLDLCAAPGGKTTHIAQLAGDKARVVAADIHSHRLGRVQENAERLGLSSILTVCADGVAPPFGDAAFDRVLVDAPCTGLGTMRRHPDLKWRVSPDDAARLAEIQYSLLRSAVQQCKNAGVIVYSVCTVTPQETGDVIDRLLASTEGLQREDGPEWLNQWKIETGTYRTLPGAGGLDGFFLTRLRKGS